MNGQEEAKARMRQEALLEVLAGRMSATEAARQLGISRKTFYQWQARGLEGMLLGLRDRPGGRPPAPVDPQKEQLRASVQELEKERTMLEGRLRIQQALREVLGERPPGPPPRKKRTV